MGVPVRPGVGLPQGKHGPVPDVTSTRTGAPGNDEFPPNGLVSKHRTHGAHFAWKSFATTASSVPRSKNHPTSQMPAVSNLKTHCAESATPYQIVFAEKPLSLKSGDTLPALTDTSRFTVLVGVNESENRFLKKKCKKEARKIRFSLKCLKVFYFFVLKKIPPG